MIKKTISLIIPCYNEEGNIEEMYNRVRRTFQKLPNYTYEIVFIDNNSEDTSERIFHKLAKNDKKVKVILMARNFGSPQPSFLAGLAYCSGSAAVLLHGDIQDPPELIPAFVKKWQEGYNVVYGVRPKRKGYSFIWNFFYRAFYFLLRKLSYIDIPVNAGEFSLIDRRVIQELLSLDEYDYNLRCLRAYVGFKQTGIEYIREARTHGRSTESFITGLGWAKTFIVNFSFKPLELISKTAFLVMFFSFVLLIANIIMYIYYHDSPRGIPTIIFLVLFLGGVQLLSLSIIAEYLAKIFLEVKKRPRYIVGSVLNGKIKNYA